MSSIHIDASGMRALSCTMNDPARTTAQLSTKDDDDVTVFAGANGGEISVVVPIETPVKVIGKDGHEAVVLKLSSLNAMIYSKRRLTDGEHGSYPHVSVSARKEIPDSYAGWETGRESTLSELLSEQ